MALDPLNVLLVSLGVMAALGLSAALRWQILSPPTVRPILLAGVLEPEQRDAFAAARRLDSRVRDAFDALPRRVERNTLV